MNEYVGRTTDLLITQVPSLSQKTLLTSSLGGGGKVCTGVQKAIQEWYILFLTDRGSVLSDPSYGTEFLPLCRTSNISDKQVVRSVFATAESQRQRWSQQNKDLTDMPDDEVVTVATLTSFTINDGKLSLNILLTTRAGVNRTIIVPISLVPTGV